MCGIAGVLLKSGCEVDQLSLLKMAEILRHRGPDYSQTVKRKHFGCVHTRLSIVDLSPAGNQPFVNDRYVLVYNGEIYNHLALREKLRVQPHEFRGTSDTATLFSSLTHFGVERTLELIRGMFAFAFYDCVEETLYLCRDRFGIKPLVWKGGANGLYWASEAKALGPVTTLEPDPVKALHSLAGIADHSAEYTAFKDVWQVPPGNYLVCKMGHEPVLREYYSLASQVSQAEYNELDRTSTRKVCETFLWLFRRSVKSMLMSDAPMGAFVSGGVDSSLVAAAVGNGFTDFQLFTANVVGRFSEYQDARLLADHIGRELHQSRFEPQQMIEDWAHCTYHYEAPIVTHTNSIPFASVARVARQRGVKAVLTGEGSDELFYGYPHLL
ncbi:MAG: asparagine synthase (glutamine-hydrolyzing), partial [Verrucomicrobia bacterium]